ncbi:MAG: hypothetical protein ACRDK9_03895 [Solirubrobacterales bacterium]
MNARRSKAPSPAMVIAVVALSLAVAGTAVAGTDAVTRAITKSKVKKIAKKQANKRINKRESGLNVNSAKTAGNASSLGGVPADQYAQRLFAVVNHDGALIRGANAVDATRVDEGEYDVTFNRDVSQCSWIAGHAAPGATPGFAPGVMLVTEQRQDGADPEVVEVKTRDAGGITDAVFHLQVIC